MSVINCDGSLDPSGDPPGSSMTSGSRSIHHLSLGLLQSIGPSHVGVAAVQLPFYSIQAFVMESKGKPTDPTNSPGRAGLMQEPLTELHSSEDPSQMVDASLMNLVQE